MPPRRMNFKIMETERNTLDLHASAPGLIFFVLIYERIFDKNKCQTD